VCLDLEVAQQAELGGAIAGELLVGDPDFPDNAVADFEHAVARLAGDHVPVVRAPVQPLAEMQTPGGGREPVPCRTPPSV